MNKKSTDIIKVHKDLQSIQKHMKAQVVAKQEEKEKKTGESAYSLWHNRIQQTLQWRSNYWNGDKNWDNAYRMYKGKHWRDQDVNDPSSDSPRDRITVNITGSTIQNIGPFLMNSNAQFSIKPRKPESNVSSAIQQSVLNYEWKQRKIQPQLRKCIDDAMIIGHGVAKTGFTLELDEAIKAADGEIVYEDYIKEEAPYARRISPKNFLFDPSASECNLATARWCAELFYVPIPDILANDSYDSKVINEIKAGKWKIQTKQTVFGDTDMHLSDDTTQQPIGELGACFEVWDKKFKKYYVYAFGVIPPLLEKDWPYPYLEGFPYKMVQFIPLNDEPYGFGIPAMIQDQQYELNRKRTALFNHTRINNRKYQVLDTVEPSELLKLEAGEDGTIITVPNINAVMPIHDLPLSPDVYNQEGIIKEDVRALTGADALIQGGALPSRTTAGEVNARGNLFRAKLDDRVGAVDTFVLEVAEQILQHVKANYITDKITKIVGPEGEYWQTYTVEDIQDDVDIDMESIAAPKTDPLLDRQQAVQILQISMQALPLIQAQMLHLNMDELFKWVFEKMDVKDAGRFFAPSLLPNAPLAMAATPGSQGQDQAFQVPNVNTQAPDAASIGQQAGLAPLLNQSGLQL
jgi:hypothetical protein